MKLLLWASLFVITFSCTTPIVRTDYVVEEIGDYLVSNSQTNPYLFDKKQDSIADFRYTLIIKNNSKVSKTLYPNFNSHITIEGASKKLNCKALKSTSIAPKEKQRIDCKIDLDVAQFPILINKDVFAEIAISIDKKNIFLGKYKILAQDFE